MIHKHLETIPSTQDYLQTQYQQAKEGILVSCDEQTKGLGRQERSWHFFPGSIAFSFTLRPNENLTLTSLEIPILLSRYFEKKYKLGFKFKWPNDLVGKHDEKIGGIILNKVGTHDLIIGVGMNINPIYEKILFDYPIGSLAETEISFSARKLAGEIYQFILSNRLSASEVIYHWNQGACHLKKEVILHDQNQSHRGTFLKLGSNGQAIILIDGEEQEFYSGSLEITH